MALNTLSAQTNKNVSAFLTLTPQKVRTGAAPLPSTQKSPAESPYLRLVLLPVQHHRDAWHSCARARSAGAFCMGGTHHGNQDWESLFHLCYTESSHLSQGLDADFWLAKDIPRVLKPLRCSDSSI